MFSRKEKTAPRDVETLTIPPRVTAKSNDSLQACLQVLGAHLLFFNSWGIINTFGAFQTYYSTTILRPYNTSSISWIGTMQAFLLIVFSIIAGPIFDRGYFRHLISVGTFLVVFGMMMTSLSTKFWQLFLAQGICVGLGAGCLFLPSVAVVATYFQRKRALALGITAAGGSIGSVIYPIVFHRLQPKIGFPWATRVLGFIALVLLIISILITKTTLPRSKTSRKLVDLKAFRSPTFVLLCVGMFLMFIGLYIPFFYIITYSEIHIGTGQDLSFYLLSVLNAASVPGRIFPGMLADKFGPLEVLIAFAIASAIVAYALLAVRNLAGVIIFCIFYGFLSGAVVSLPPSVIAGLAPDMKLVGTWMGMCFCFAGLGILIGNPIAGTVIHVEENEFSGGLIFSASTIMAGALVVTLCGFVKARQEAKTKGMEEPISSSSAST